MISFVIPLLNEEESLEALHEAITQAVEPLPYAYEIIFVDDGSTDRSPAVLQDLYRRIREHVRVIQFRRNFGKTAGPDGRFRPGAGRDRRHAGRRPAGRSRRAAQAPGQAGRGLRPGRRLASRTARTLSPSGGPPSFANATVSALTGIKLHDRELRVQGLPPRGGAGSQAVRRAAPLSSRCWPIGRAIASPRCPSPIIPAALASSKYGARRLARSYVDFLSVLFLTTYLKRPMHLFGLMGSAFAAVGTVIMLYLAGLWLVEGGIGWRPLLFFGITALVVGIQLISVGLLGEMLRNITFRAEDEYSIRQIWDTFEGTG